MNTCQPIVVHPSHPNFPEFEKPAKAGQTLFVGTGVCSSASFSAPLLVWLFAKNFHRKFSLRSALSRQTSSPHAWLRDSLSRESGLPPRLRDAEKIGTGIAPSGILWYIRYQMPMPGTHSV